MRAPQYRCCARQVQSQIVDLLCDRLHLIDFSPCCSAGQLLSAMLLAAVHCVSLSAAAVLRSRGPCRETLRQAWRATLPDYDRLQRQLPGVLRGSLPRGLRKRQRQRRRYPMALDLHLVPYYKRQQAVPVPVRKGKRLEGTAYSHQYATVSLLRKGQYYVVAQTPYVPGEDLAELVRRLLRQAAANGFAPRYVLMDRSFWSADVFRYLQRARYPFLLPVLGRGKRPDKPGGPTGTQQFLHGLRRSGFYRYTVRNRQGQGATVTIVVHRRNHAGRKTKHGRYTWAYGLWRVKLSSVVWVRESYRRRFRIESSYRLLEEARGRTSSRDAGVRLWYVVLALLLVNAWLQARREESRQGRDSEGCWANRLYVVIGQILAEQRQHRQRAARAAEQRR